MMDTSHPLYATLNVSDAAALVSTAASASVGTIVEPGGSGGTSAPTGHTTQFSSLAVIDHLQSSLRHEHERRVELEKELTILRKRVRDLEVQLATKDDRTNRTSDLHQAHLRSIKSKLVRTLKNATTNSSHSPSLSHSNSISSNSGHHHHHSHQQNHHNHANHHQNSSYDLELIEIDSPPRRIEFEHRCDECSFHSKSEVALILHKMNHSIVEQQYVLSSTSFTTRNSNSKNVYNCPACDTVNMTRHEVYRHIYDLHTTEKPLPCPFCEYSFTLKDYLDDHVRSKHAKAQNSKSTILRPDATILNNSLLSAETTWSTKLLATATATTASSSSATSGGAKTNTSNASSHQNHHSAGGGGGSTVTTTTNSANNSSAAPLTTVITPTIKTKAPGRGRPPGSTSAAKSGTELKCTFLDCNFTTISQDKLDFHMKAHINTKYKCPYCPYVSNTIIDIKRHIQKSKKHEGMKMYSCQKCGFGADCDRMFKEHLRAYHFGYEVHDTVVDYFIEEMFSNKNNKRPGEDDILGQAQLAQLQHQLQNPVLHHPPLGAGSGVDHPPPMKKLASSLAIAAERKGRGRAAATAAALEAASAASTITTMIEEQTDHGSSTPHLQVQQQQQQQQQSSMESLALISNYRAVAQQQQQQNSNAANTVQLTHQQTNQLVNSLGLNAQNASVLMYHHLHDQLTSATAGGGVGGSSSQNASHHQHQSVSQHHQFQQQQQHHGINLATIQQQQAHAQHGAEALIVQQVVQQRQQQQQVPSRPQSQQAQQQQQQQNGQFVVEPNALSYVTYANY